MNVATRQAGYLHSLSPYSRLRRSTGFPALRGQPATAGSKHGYRRIKNMTDKALKPNAKKRGVVRNKDLRVPVLPDEEKEIKHLAKSVGLDVAPYLRNIGLGYRVSSVLDLQKVDELAKISGDLGRLGGLLKLWLTNDEKLSQFDPIKTRNAIELALSKILENQQNLRETIEALIDRERFSR